VSKFPVFCFYFALAGGPLAATEWHVAPGGSGDGSPGDPFGAIQDGIDAAQPGDTVTVGSGGDYLSIKDCEIRKSSRDCLDMSAPEGVLIEGSSIHHCLNWQEQREDAHGIVGGPVRNLTVRDTEIHTFSGDALQFDPSRSTPGWDDITVEGCTLWLAPLASPENGFPAGTAPGENAIDTKTYSGNVSNLTIHDTIAYGFRDGFINNMAAFNLKENIDATLDGVTVYDSEIAFRLRGPDAGANEYCPGDCSGPDSIFDDDFETGDTSRWSSAFPP